MTPRITSADTRREFDAVLGVYAPVAGAVVLVVVVALVVAVRRRRDGAPGAAATAPRLEAAYVALLALVAVGLTWRSLTALHAVGGPDLSGSVAQAGSPVLRTPPAVTIRVVAARWQWRFEYPGGVVQAGAGPHATATLVVPADRQVRFRVTSADVVHAIWIPDARFKVDAVPGRVNVVDMLFERGRRYANDRCSEFCGTYHQDMTFGVQVRDPEDFAVWLAARRATAAAR
jgi:cytochrome c oxidase subunit 2